MLKCGDIILMHNRGFIGKAIHWVLNFFQSDPAKYTHVAVAISETQVAEAKLDGIILHSPYESLRDAKRYKIIRYKFLTKKAEERLKELLLSKVGTKYNYWRLGMQLLDNISGTNWFTKHLAITKEENICSTYVKPGSFTD